MFLMNKFRAAVRGDKGLSFMDKDSGELGAQHMSMSGCFAIGQNNSVAFSAQWLCFVWQLFLPYKHYIALSIRYGHDSSPLKSVGIRLSDAWVQHICSAAFLRLKFQQWILCSLGKQERPGDCTFDVLTVGGTCEMAVRENIIQLPGLEQHDSIDLWHPVNDYS
jgi:hypothetical protein